MNFKTWLEAYVSKEGIPLDQDDIDYLKQFPIQHWPQALKSRYNDFLIMALDGNGELSDDFRNQIIFEDKIIQIGIDKVINKLKKYGYDLRGTNPVTKVTPYFRPLELDSAKRHIANLLKTDPEFVPMRGKRNRINVQNLNLNPNAIVIHLNKLAKRRDDAEFASNDDLIEKRESFAQRWPELETYVRKSMSVTTPNKAWYELEENKEELVELVRQRVWQYWNVLHDKTLQEIKVFINSELQKAGQRGMYTRRMYVKFKNAGVNLTQLPGTPKKDGSVWTPHDIKKVMDSALSFEDKLKAFQGR